MTPIRTISAEKANAIYEADDAQEAAAAEGRRVDAEAHKAAHRAEVEARKMARQAESVVRKAEAQGRREARRAETEARRAEVRARKEATRRPAEMHNVSRLESGTTRGWSVRFQRGGEKHGRFFKDADHGGADGALVAAQAWRDERREALGPAHVAGAGRVLSPEARQRNRESVSQTGVTGISVIAREFSAQHVPYVTAYWIDGDGRRRQTSFSTARHGIAGALRLAAQARAETADWHGAPALSADEIFEAALDPVSALAGPYLATPAT